MKKEFQLPKNIAEPWIKALRSGEYEQGQEFLYRNFSPDDNGEDVRKDCYCCLGVLAKINNCEIEAFGQVNLSELEEQDFLSQLPSDIVSEYGDLAKRLINMNDTQNKSFKQIADWIEENVEFV